MDQLKGKNPVLFVVVIVLAGAIWYFFLGGPSGSSSEAEAGSVDQPHNAFVMTVSSVQSDGSFRGKVEQSDRHAQQGLRTIGTYDRVTLRLADVTPLDPVRDECWAEESQDATKDLIGGRIWVDPKDVDQQGRGTFLVYAWNRDGAFVQESLLADGNGTLFSGRTSPTYGDVLADAEDSAARAEKGRWGACGDS